MTDDRIFRVRMCHQCRSCGILDEVWEEGQKDERYWCYEAKKEIPEPMALASFCPLELAPPKDWKERLEKAQDFARYVNAVCDDEGAYRP